MKNISARKVLIVEDSLEIQDSLREILELESYHVNVANNGQEAMDYLESASDLPQVILLDLRMPIMNGYQFRKLQTEDPRFNQVPVIMMTADHNATTRSEYTSANAFLRKPLDMEVFLNTVEKFCPR